MFRFNNPVKITLGASFGLAFGVVGVGFCQSLSLIDDMHFGMTDVASNPPGGTLQLGTNGTITYGSNLSGNGNGIAGKVQLTGTTGQGIELRCSSSATLAHSNASTIGLNPVKVSFATPQTYATASNCIGTSITVATGTLSATASDNIAYLAGQLDIAGSTVHGSYNTTNMGGVPITLTVIFN